MKYLIEAMGKDKKDTDYQDIEIPVEIDIDGARENTSLVFDLGDGKDWWIPISEIDYLLYIVEGLVSEEENG